MEWSFVADFLKVAEDEAKHFTLLEERLGELGTRFGDLKVHGALWESAEETKDSLFSRLAIVHLVRFALAFTRSIRTRRYQLSTFVLVERV